MKCPQILIVVALMLTFSATAQKIKVKKGEILVDKNPVAKLIKNEAEDAPYKYSLASMADEVAVNFNLETKTVGETSIYRWLSLKEPNGELVNESDFEFLSFTLNTNKGLAEFLMKKLEFFTKDGINSAKIKEFFAEKRTSENKVKANEAELKKEAGLKIYNEINPVVTPEMTIVAKGILDQDGKPSALGKVSFSKKQVQGSDDRNYTFYNVLGKSAATATTFFKRIEAGRKYYPLGNGDLSSIDKVSEANNILKVIFTTEELRALFPTKAQAEEAYQANKEKQQADYEEAKANSSNIYNEKGIVIDQKGEKWEGDVSVAFEEVKNPADWGGMVDISTYGNSLGLRYVNEKGKKKFKSFSAKDGIRFSIMNEDGSKTNFQGLKVQSNGLLAKATNASGNKFFKEILEEGKVTLYQSLPGNEYVIKIKGQDKGFNFVFGDLIKEEKKVAKLKEYLGGCDYGDGKYDEASFENIDKIKELINFYNTSCK